MKATSEQQKVMCNNLDDEKLVAAFLKAAGGWEKNIEIACIFLDKATPDQPQAIWSSINLVSREFSTWVY